MMFVLIKNWDSNLITVQVRTKHPHIDPTVGTLSFPLSHIFYWNTGTGTVPYWYGRYR